MVKAQELRQDWRIQLDNELPEQNATTKESIIHWVLGKDVQQLETLNPDRVETAKRVMAYRYRILRRYLGFEPEQAYRRLITRLASSLRLNKICSWMAASREHQRTVVGILQEVLQEMLSSDPYLQEQMVLIAQCTVDVGLRNALLFASLEEYCLRPIRNQPLITYQLVNYLRRCQTNLEILNCQSKIAISGSLHSSCNCWSLNQEQTGPGVILQEHSDTINESCY